MKHVRNIAIVLALAALVYAARGPGVVATNALLWVLNALFLGLFAWFAMVMYRQFRGEIHSLDDRMRLVLYASIGLAVLTLTASQRLWNIGGPGTLLWIALLAAASGGVYAAWRSYRRY